VGEVLVRPVEITDAHDVAAIYAPIVENTHISFELDPPTTDEIRQRITTVTTRYPWLVATIDAQVIGYAYAAEHNTRAAYQWAVDTSIYLSEHARGRGVGTLLYTHLLDELRSLGYVSAFAGIALPNAASAALHQRVGFTEVGCFAVAGFKFGRWIDVSLWRRSITEPTAAPTQPTSWQSRGTSAYTPFPGMPRLARRVRRGGGRE
jgi:phosphinothricin acetyltransferase